MLVRFNRTICRAATGAVSPLATVEVRVQSTNLLANLYSDISGGTPLSNPFTADANGFVGFFLEVGSYRIIITSADGSEAQTLIYEPASDPDAVSQEQFLDLSNSVDAIAEDISDLTAIVGGKQNALGFTPINKSGDSGIGALTLIAPLRSPSLVTESSVPVHIIKDTDTSGAGILGYTAYYDVDGVNIGLAGFTGGGIYEIKNLTRPIKLNSASVEIVGSLSAASANIEGALKSEDEITGKQFSIKDDETNDIALMFARLNFRDSTSAIRSWLGLSGDGKFRFYFPAREFYFDGSLLNVAGAFQCGGGATIAGAVSAATLTLVGGFSAGASSSIAGTLTVTNLSVTAAVTAATISTTGSVSMGASSSVAGNFTATGNFIGVNANLSGNVNAQGLNGNAVTITAAVAPALKAVDAANAANFGSFYYHVPSLSVFVERSGTIVLEASGTQTRLADQVGAPILIGNTSTTKLYRGGVQCLEATSTNTKLQIGASYSPFDASTTQTTIKSAGNATLDATATETNIYRGTTPVILANSSSHSLRSPIGAPVLESTSTTTAINAGNGAPSINIDSAGAVDVSGNVTLSGSSRRIKSDLSNATITNRLHIQTTTANGATRVSAIPNGSGTTCNFEAYNNSDPTNASAVRVTATSTDTRLESIISGTGIYLPLQIYNNGAAKITIPPAGNILFNEGNVQLNAAVGQSSLHLSQAGTINGRVYASGGAGTDASLESLRNTSLKSVGDNLFINGLTGLGSGGVTNQVFALNGNAGFGVTSPTTKARIQSSNGIHLGNSANSNVDVLDYYEEQINFTVVVYGGTSPGSCTYTTRSGKGTRTGNEFSGQILVGWTGHTGTGDLYISGLPFTNFSINAAITIFADGLVGPAGSTSFQGFGVGGGANISISTIAATTGVKSNVQLGSNTSVTNVTINFKHQIL